MNLQPYLFPARTLLRKQWERRWYTIRPTLRMFPCLSLTGIWEASTDYGHSFRLTVRCYHWPVRRIWQLGQVWTTDLGIYYFGRDLEWSSYHESNCFPTICQNELRKPHEIRKSDCTVVLADTGTEHSCNIVPEHCRYSDIPTCKSRSFC
jgi:hypothetical protein